ncbi:hypothetical protein A2W14_02705 [Candidatus Gottesmanbacteria bacterium RBG_16_37_8]|uniref:Cohesin domain-containing protein n=1 Tax=Candidatus Gottesmanbacteria bacterium RBG_16_37_8 TaxID=1798371 RepID=A0A1F5YPY7_9BACT|nr:MAG: hypothetical protein A2W14_02705 [Candidatus Gottesmanbacteria bacterium RBG_16_37_8]
MKKTARVSSKSVKKTNSPLLPVFFLVLILILLVFISFKVKKEGSNSIKLNFEPIKLVLLYPSTKNDKIITEAEVKIKASAYNRKIAFVRVVLTFDPTKIHLVSEITTNPNLSTVVEKSGLSVANSEGKIVFVIAASPEDNPPTGEFELASFQIAPGLVDKEEMTTVDFLTSDMQIVDKEVQELKIIRKELDIRIRPNE